MKTLVAYCDGSARPNPGNTGYGVHAYITDPDGKKKNLESKYKITNKGYINKAIFKEADDLYETGVYKIIDIYGYSKSSKTNNTAELDAVVKVLEFILNPAYEKIIDGVNNIVLILDSTYVFAIIEKILNGKEFDVANTANMEYIDKLKELVNTVLRTGITIELQKIKGHSGHLGNDRADLLSNIGRVLNTRMQDEYYDKILIKDRDEYFISSSKQTLAKLQLYYSNKEIPNTRLITYKGDTLKEINKIGSRSSEISYVIVTNDLSDTYVEMVKQYIDTAENTVIKPYVLKLDVINSKPVLQNLNLYGEDYIITDNGTYTKIMTVDNVELASEIYPPALSYIANREFDNLQSVLDAYLSNSDEYIKVDITDLLYTNNKLKSEIINDKYVISVDVSKYIPYKRKVKLHFGIDFPKRNYMKKLDNKNISIYLYMLKYDRYTIYYTVIEYDTNDNREIIITYNKYSACLYH